MTLPIVNAEPQKVGMSPNREIPTGNYKASQAATHGQIDELKKSIEARMSSIVSPSNFLQQGLYGALGNNPISQIISGIGSTIGDTFNSLISSPEEKKGTSDIGKLTEVIKDQRDILKTNTHILDGILDAVFHTNTILSKLSVNGVSATKTQRTKSFVKDKDESPKPGPVKLTVFNKKEMANNIEQLYGKKEEKPTAPIVAPITPVALDTIAPLLPVNKLVPEDKKKEAKVDEALKLWELIILGKNKEAIKSFSESLQKVTKSFSKTVDDVTKGIKSSAEKNSKVKPENGKSADILSALSEKVDEKAKHTKVLTAGAGYVAVENASRKHTNGVASKIVGANSVAAAPILAAVASGKMSNYDDENKEIPEKEEPSTSSNIIGDVAEGVGTASLLKNSGKIAMGAARFAGGAGLVAGAGAAGYYGAKALGADDLGSYLGEKAYNLFNSGENDKVADMLTGKNQAPTKRNNFGVSGDFSDDEKLTASAANNRSDKLDQMNSKAFFDAPGANNTPASQTVISAPTTNQNTTILPSRTIIRNPEQSVNRYLNNTMRY